MSEQHQALAAARDYLARGWCPIPIPRRRKGPVLPEWEHLRLTDADLEQHFGRAMNVGINLGEPSHGLADVDLDCEEALELATRILPATAIFGRASKPRSHWLFVAEGAITEQFCDLPEVGKPRGATLVELRATPASRAGQGVGGHQTVFPGSVHPSGEAVEWSDRALEPVVVPAVNLRALASRLACACLLARHCPDTVEAFLETPAAVPEGVPVRVADLMRAWLRISAPGAEAEPARPQRLTPQGGPSWFTELRSRGVRTVAPFFGCSVQAEPKRGMSPCPKCGEAKRGSTDKRAPVDITSDGLGWTCWHCGAKGDAVNLAALRVTGCEQPTPQQWGEVRERCAAAGLCSPDRPVQIIQHRPEPPPPGDEDAPPPEFIAPAARTTASGSVLHVVGSAAVAAAPDAPESAPASAPSATPATARRPIIYIRPDEHEVVSEAIAAIAPDTRLYQRGGELVQVLTDQGQLAGVTRPASQPRIAPIQQARLRELVAERARWLKRGTRGADWQHAHPPDWAVREILDRGEWPRVRPLEAVVETPVLRPDGSVIDRPGYDDATGILVLPNCQIDSIPEHPTREQAESAVDQLAELVCDFPFAAGAHLSCWIAGLLTPLARFAFSGPSPLFLVDANVRGAGKSKLCDVISVLLTGRAMDRQSFTDDEDEMRKAVLTIASEGERFVLLDNINRPLGGGVLDGALTGQSAKGRRLGKNESMRGTLIATWYGTGNNVQFVGDTARRVLPIRLDSALERPEDRQGFAHADLLGWARGERSRLVAAALTILRGYYANGAPDMHLRPWGSFEEWSAVVRNAMVWAGCTDPADARQALMASADGDASGLAALIAGWDELDPGRQGVSASEALQRLKDDRFDAQRNYGERYTRLRDAILELCPGRNGDLPDARRLGYQLRHFRGRIVGGRRLDSAVNRDGVSVWFVADAGQRAAAPRASEQRACGNPHGRTAGNEAAGTTGNGRASAGDHAGDPPQNAGDPPQNRADRVGG